MRPCVIIVTFYDCWRKFSLTNNDECIIFSLNKKYKKLAVAGEPYGADQWDAKGLQKAM
jgi:hypothetical protein